MCDECVMLVVGHGPGVGGAFYAKINNKTRTRLETKNKGHVCKMCDGCVMLVVGHGHGGGGFDAKIYK